MIKRNTQIIIAMVCFLLFPSILNAVDIRGRINGLNQYSPTPYPLGGMTIDLYWDNYGRWVYIARYITGPDGMYYFRNIQPGYYSLQINGRTNYSITISNIYNQDLPPIVITY